VTLLDELSTFITDVGTDWKNLWAKIGTGSLNTTAQNLTGAINEVKVTADAGGAAPASTTVAGVSERATDAEALAMSATDLTITPGNIGAIRGVANGLAGLDGGGKVPSAQLPAFVDDVIEGANLAAFPGTGETGKIYVALDTGFQYRWSGSAYTRIVSSPGTTTDLAEGTNLYYTDARADTRANGRITALVGDTNTDLAALYTAAKA
jgi:hypothetical protein